MCEDHVTPNVDKYQKSAELQFRYCLAVS